MASQTGKPTTGNEPVVMMSNASRTTTGVDGRQAVALQSVTLAINPVNISEGESTTDTCGVSPNTSPTEITQPLIGTEGATDPKSTGRVIEPCVRFYVGYQSLTDCECHKSIQDNAIAAYEETLGDGTLQAYVQQLEAAFADAVCNMEDDDDPSMSLVASGLEKADRALRADILRNALLVDETDDLRQQLEESRRQRIAEALHHEQHMRDLQKQLDLETTLHQRSRKRLSAEISSHRLSQKILSAERASHDELHALYHSLCGMRSASRSLASKHTILQEVSLIPTRSFAPSKVAVRNQLGGHGVSQVAKSRAVQELRPVPATTVRALQSVPLAPLPAAPAFDINDCSPIDVSTIITDVKSQRPLGIEKQRRFTTVAALAPVKTSVWDTADRESCFRPLAQDKHPRSNVINGNAMQALDSVPLAPPPAAPASSMDDRSPMADFQKHRAATVLDPIHANVCGRGNVKSFVASHCAVQEPSPVPIDSPSSRRTIPKAIVTQRPVTVTPHFVILNASPVQMGKLPVVCGSQNPSVDSTKHRLSTCSVVDSLSSNEAFGPTSGDENALVLHTYFTLVPAVAVCGADFSSDFC